MRGRYKRKETQHRTRTDADKVNGLSEGILPWTEAPGTDRDPGRPASPPSDPGGLTLTGLHYGQEKFPSSPKSDGEKRYLGVRVKMPVKDMLRNIRLAKGWDPHDVQQNCTKRSKGEKRRVNTCKERLGRRKRAPTKSLEELAIIVEVLEEDLKTGNAFRSHAPQNLHPSDLSSSLENSPCDRSDNPLGALARPHVDCLEYDPQRWAAGTMGYRLMIHEADEGPRLGSSGQGTGYLSDESDDMIPSPQYSMTCSQAQVQAPAQTTAQAPISALNHPDWLQYHGPCSCSVDEGWGWGQEEWLSHETCGLNTAAFFSIQLQREENQLGGVPDAALLTTDGHGRTALHRVVCMGKRAQGYAIAKRMAASNSLDVKDSEGKTALHLAAKQNQHLMVADLIRLGTSVNERDASGKTCLHLCAENGYIRVLEVLKHAMNNGVFVDVEATDNYGLSVLQCAALALSATVRDLERSDTLGQVRLHTLRKEQLMETLECLLQMDNCLPAQGCGYGENAFDVASAKESNQFVQGVVSKSSIKKGTMIL